MQDTFMEIVPILLFTACLLGLAVALLVMGKVINPSRVSRVKRMPYESGMDPIHDTRRRFDVRFHLLAIAFLVFDVELLFLYPWAVAAHPGPAAAVAPLDTATTLPATPDLVEPTPDAQVAPRGIDAAVADGLVESRHLVFGGVMVFLALLTLGLVYDWRKGVFRWR